MKKWLFAAALLIPVLNGCQNSVNTIGNAEKEAVPTVLKDARFQTDDFLRDRLLLRNINVADRPGGVRVAQVTAYNDRVGIWSYLTAPEVYKIEYRFDWSDADGMQVKNSASNIWRTKRIEAGETVYFEAVAPSTQCRDFILNIRESEQ